MNRHYIAAIAIAVLNIAIYPLMCQLAYLERGYAAHGGEDLLFIVGFIAAFWVASCGKKAETKKGGF